MIRYVHWLGLFIVIMLMLVGTLIVRSPVPANVQAAAASTPTPTPAPFGKTVQPAVGAPGTTFTFSAQGFRKHIRIYFWASPPQGLTVGDPSYFVETDEKGNATWKWTAPVNAINGVWLMVFQTDRFSPAQTISFEIQGTAPATEVNAAPSVQSGGVVQPSVGTPGTTFTFSSQDFTRKESVHFWLNTPDGNVRGDLSYQTRAGQDGQASWTWTAPNDAINGHWQMVAYGMDSKITKVIDFTIQS